MKRLYPVATALALLTVACTGGSETGNPAVPVTLALALHTTDENVASVAGTSGLVVDEAFIHISELSFVLASRCIDVNDDDEVELPGPFVVQLRRAAATIQDLLLRSEGYCGVEVDLERAGSTVPAGAPAELARQTLVVRGQTPLGVPFVVITQEEFELEITSADAPFTVDEISNHLVLSFDVARWFAGIDLDALSPSPDGVIHVDLESHIAMLRAFEANVEAAMELARDDNDNRELDDDDERLVTRD